MRQLERYAPDLDVYHERARTGPCFVCGIVARDPTFPAHHIACEDDGTIAFFSGWPTRYGYTPVARKEHRDRATGDFARVVYRVTESVRREVGTDEGKARVRWHVVPPQPGTPYEEQPAAVMPEKASLAARVGGGMEGT